VLAIKGKEKMNNTSEIKNTNIFLILMLFGSFCLGHFIFLVPRSKLEELRTKVIEIYGEKLELIAPTKKHSKQSKKRKRKKKKAAKD
jgi:hypothetical protein